MGSLIIVLTAFAIYCSEVYCDTLPTEVAKPEDIVLLEKNNSHAIIEKGSFWKNLNLTRYKPKLEESRNLNGINNEDKSDKRKGRFLNTLAFLTGLSFGGLANAASSTMKSITKMPQMFSINLGSSKNSPYFAVYYSQYPYVPLLSYPFYPFGLAAIDAVKPQTSQNDLTPQIINLFDNRPIDLAGNNEDYTDAEKSNNGADARIRLRAEADRNAEEKATINRCKEDQRKHGKGTAREREYLQVNANDLQATLNFRDENQTVPDNATTTSSPDDTNTTSSPDNTNTTSYYHHYYYHHKEFPEYYGGYPQTVHHVEFTTTQPYSQISYNVPYEQPNFYHDDKYNVYSGLHPSFSAPFSPERNDAGTDFNQLYPPRYQPPNIDGFKPLK